MRWVLAGLVVLSLVVGLVGMMGAHRKQRRLHDRLRAVGLDLEALVALLPPHLRDRRYTALGFSPVQREDADVLLVGLIYEDARPRAGNPPNVGLELHVPSRTVVELHPDGIGLGYK